jgi:hypothetical protein
MAQAAWLRRQPVRQHHLLWPVQRDHRRRWPAQRHRPRWLVLQRLQPWRDPPHRRSVRLPRRSVPPWLRT